MNTVIKTMLLAVLGSALGATERQVTLTIAQDGVGISGLLCRTPHPSAFGTTNNSGSTILAVGTSSQDYTIYFQNPVTAPVLEQYVIDGFIDFSDLGPVDEAPLTFRDALTTVETGVSTVYWAWRNDDRWAYLAIEWADPTFDNSWSPGVNLTIDQVRIRIDPDGDGSFDPSDDHRYLFPAFGGCQFRDEHQAGEDTVGDGDGRIRYDAGRQVYQAEFLIPLHDDSAGQDGDLGPNTRFDLIFGDALTLVNGVFTSGSVAAINGNEFDSNGWAAMPLQTVAPLTHPQPPAGLGGLITYIRNKPNDNGDIFVYDPGTGITTEVQPTDPGALATFNTLKKENVSLSNDLSRIAFHGFTSGDYSTAEIYIIAVDGSSLVQLTNNSILDGHPGWSPDDSQICYATFDPAYTGAHIVVRNSDGSGGLTDLTLASTPQIGDPGYYEDDNDPDFLPDGRIIYKTNRFTPWSAPNQNQVRIAVMDADGSNVIQVSSGSDVVDHDAVGDATDAIWERIPKDLNFVTDSESFFIRWLLFIAPLSGSGPMTELTSDDWINWLPVFDPTGAYIAYLKTSGMTEIRLMTRSGEDRGRLVPNMTSASYLDWKAGPAASLLKANN